MSAICRLKSAHVERESHESECLFYCTLNTFGLKSELKFSQKHFVYLARLSIWV